MARRKDHEGLDDLATQIVGAGHHGGLGYGWMLDQCALDLERADAVAGAEDHIIGAAHEPEIAVLIDDRPVAGNIPITADAAGAGVGVAPVP
ncbi:MAG: hypothetical protein U0Z44_00830 [Kouleothrix sp.]